MFFQKIYTDGLSIYSYLLGDEETKQAVVVDPTRLVTPYIVAAENAGLTITTILETHIHADFVSGAKELKYQLKNKPLIYTSELGGKQWAAAYADCKIKDRESIQIGTIRLEAWHTPGHTPEHVMWIVYDETRNSHVPWFAFSGDCLFVNSIGRPDLLGEGEIDRLTHQLYETLFETLKPLPDSLEIFPAHGAGSLCGKALSHCSTSTLGYERQCNPYLREAVKEDWIAAIKKIGLSIPPYFARVKRLNVEGPPLLDSLKIEECQQLLPFHQESFFLLDVRHPELFARFHIEGAINIPLTSSFCHWCGWIVPDQMPLVLILEQKKRIKEVVDQLRLIGFDQAIYTFILKEEEAKSLPLLSHFAYLSVEDVAQRRKDIEKNLFILDVRSHTEWQAGHLADAHHIELNELYRSMHTLPQEGLIAVICRSGSRASTAASLLKKYGFSQVANIRGGMLAWNQLNLPVLTG